MRPYGIWYRGFDIEVLRFRWNLPSLTLDQNNQCSISDLIIWWRWICSLLLPWIWGSVDQYLFTRLRGVTLQATIIIFIIGFLLSAILIQTTDEILRSLPYCDPVTLCVMWRTFYVKAMCVSFTITFISIDLLLKILSKYLPLYWKLLKRKSCVLYSYCSCPKHVTQILYINLEGDC
jgi:hypothetical protein